MKWIPIQNLAIASVKLVELETSTREAVEFGRWPRVECSEAWGVINSRVGAQIHRDPTDNSQKVYSLSRHVEIVCATCCSSC